MKKKTAIIIGLTSLLVALTAVVVLLGNFSEKKSIVNELMDDKRTNVVCNFYVSGHEKSYAFFEEDGKLAEAAVVDSFYSLLDKEIIEKNLNNNYENLEDILKDYVKFEFEYDETLKKATMITRYDLTDMPIEFFTALNLEKLLDYQLDYEKTVNAYMKSHLTHVCVGSYFKNKTDYWNLIFEVPLFGNLNYCVDFKN